MGVEHSWRMRQKQDSKSLAIQTHSLKSTHPVWDATISGADSIEVNYAKIHASHGGCDVLQGLPAIGPTLLKSTHPTGDATAKYSVCSCKKAIVRTNILYFFSSNQIG